jgi:glycine/D-amino acid oxidase-like deaminating enzyme
MRPDVDALVIGGGFYGLYVAAHLREKLMNVMVCEREADLMQRASYANQARVHNGYHYPRSIVTAFRSRVNYARFVSEFPGCIDQSFAKVYAIARKFSKVTSEQFRRLALRIGAPIRPADPSTRRLFAADFIEDVFATEECAFNAVKLKEQMEERIAKARIDVCLETKIERLQPAGDCLDVELTAAGVERKVRAGMVLNCSYSNINQPIVASGIPPIPLKHELAEIALVDVPDELRQRGVTVMCGPFFSCMPFPAQGLHSLSHVRYTPHGHWYDGDQYAPATDVFRRAARESQFPAMQRDAQRYVPLMAGCVYRGSLWEVKTVLPRNEVDDGRPILFKPHYGIRNHHVLMGGKIDNVYDVISEIDKSMVVNRTR